MTLPHIPLWVFLAIGIGNLAVAWTMLYATVKRREPIRQIFPLITINLIAAMWMLCILYAEATL